jgi:hypothetical protein
MAEIKKGACPDLGCSRTDVSITASGGLRVHAANGKRVSPENPACPGSGQDPAQVPAPSGSLRFLCPVPAGPGGCGHEVQLTANHRARSHLDGQDQPCAGGSDWPIAVDADGYREDTSEWDEARWALALALGQPKSTCEHDYGMWDAPDPDPDGDEIMVSACVKCGEIEPEEGASGLDPQHPSEVSLAEAAADKATRRMDHAALEMREDDQAEIQGQRKPATVANQAAGNSCAQTGPGCQGEVEFRRTPTHRRGAYLCTAHGGGLEESRRRVHDSVPLLNRGEDEPTPDAVFDPTHVLQNEQGMDLEVHPGEAGGCRLPGCCTHPGGFTYVDDDNGHSGSFCRTCGTEEPEPTKPCGCRVGEGFTEDCAQCRADWKTPADLLARMPREVQSLAADNPECWDCGHEVTPLAERFEPSGSVKHVVWNCSRDCAQHRTPESHQGEPCRPQASVQNHLGRLERGEFFVRHTTKPPLNGLVYRAGGFEPEPGILHVTVVSAGSYVGLTGTLTNLQEEITCTDQHGTPRPRRGHPAPAPSSPAPQPSTPSAPQEPSRTATATDPSSKPSTSPSATRVSASATVPSTRATTSGPSAAASTRTPTASKRTEPVADAFSTPKQATAESDRYDNYGRYKLLHPDTGKPVKWTRATTYAKSIQDTFALSQWAQRMTLKGAALRPDIVAAVATLDVKADRARVNALVDDAKKAAGDKVAANLGTAVHAFTEDRDKILVGMEVEPRSIPEKLLPSVDAYEELLTAFGLEPVPGLIEFTTAVKQYEIAGTSDRVYRVTRDITFKLSKRTVTLYAGEYVIGDVKTGADLSYGWMEICIQLAIYAQGLNTSGTWDWGTGSWGKPTLPGNPEVLLKVRTDVGVIAHLPVDRKEGASLATLFAVDLDAGWAAAVLCGQVRATRKLGNLATALSVADVDDAFPAGVQEDAGRAPVVRPVTTRPATLEERAHAVTTQAAASVLWKEAVASRTPKAEVDRLVRIMQEKIASHVEQGA